MVRTRVDPGLAALVSVSSSAPCSADSEGLVLLLFSAPSESYNVSTPSFTELPEL